MLIDVDSLLNAALVWAIWPKNNSCIPHLCSGGRLLGGLVGLGLGERQVKGVLLVRLSDVGENAAGGESAESASEDHD